MTNNRARGQWLRAKMERLVRDLDNAAGKPVIDATGLTGTYDIALYWVQTRRDPMLERLLYSTLSRANSALNWNRRRSCFPL